MKTPEDEAFDELERRRGGFRAKRAMAAAKSEWLPGCPICGMDAKCDCDTGTWNPPQPAQKIPYPVTGWKVEVRGSNQQLFITGVYGDTIFVDLPVQPVQPAQEPMREALAYLKATISAFGPDAGISLDKKGWSNLHAAIQAVVTQPAQDVDYWIREATAARQAEMVLRRELEAQPAQEPVAVHQFRLMYSADWHDGHPDPKDGHGPYETRTLYTAPPKRERVVFPTMLRKMWSGGEVQDWLDENVNKENT